MLKLVTSFLKGMQRSQGVQRNCCRAPATCPVPSTAVHACEWRQVTVTFECWLADQKELLLHLYPAPPPPLSLQDAQDCFHLFYFIRFMAQWKFEPAFSRFLIQHTMGAILR